ncbi:MAG: hypothetical protein KF836_04255 [Fimbriimonadaceae bacterium]|nr:hypothetical protein [Fimbriimonadaceae bacterium]
MFQGVNRIAVIGNGGGGKSTLSKELSEHLKVPWFEIDQVQFGPNWVRPPEDEVRQQIQNMITQPRWLIDGFGPYDTIQERFAAADQIIFVDFPLWIHYWWAMERQIAAHLGAKRLGGRDDCDLRDVNKLMCQSLWRVETEIKPKLLEDLKPYAEKTITISSPEELDEFMAGLK